MAGGPWCHIEHLQVPACLHWYERLAVNRMLVRYDVRGTGLSEREVDDVSLESHVMDLEAVLAHIGLDRFNLLGAADGGLAAVSYAARHPDQVVRLILWCTHAKGSDISSPRIQAWRGLIDQDWELMTDTCTQLALGWSGSSVEVERRW